MAELMQDLGKAQREPGQYGTFQREKMQKRVGESVSLPSGEEQPQHASQQRQR